MKLYIILTYDIRFIGGTQAYTWGKCEYLSRNGWDTAVYFPGKNSGVSPYKYLNKYICGGLPWLSVQLESVNGNVMSILVQKMLRAYNIENNAYSEIIIETHYDTVAIWGERIAKYLHARHICFLCNESFDAPKKYNEHLEFYRFKYERKELYGIHKSSIKQLFSDAYYNVPETEELVFHAYASRNIVQDVWDERLEKLCPVDWNIVYFGRVDKGSIITVIENIAAFAKKYNGKTIQFIIISDAFEMKKYIDETFSEIKNVIVQLFGVMSPVPKKIFEIADVVIAGAGCASWSYRNNAFTLISDANNPIKANGLLGYDTFNTLYAESNNIQKDYIEYLERLLVNRIYENMKRKEIPLLTINNYDSNDNRYDSHFQLIDKAIKDLNYYNFKKPAGQAVSRIIDQGILLIKSNDKLNKLYCMMKSGLHHEKKKSSER